MKIQTLLMSMMCLALVNCGAKVKMASATADGQRTSNSVDAGDDGAGETPTQPAPESDLECGSAADRSPLANSALSCVGNSLSANGLERNVLHLELGARINDNALNGKLVLCVFDLNGVLVKQHRSKETMNVVHQELPNGDLTVFGHTSFAEQKFQVRLRETGSGLTSSTPLKYSSWSKDARGGFTVLNESVEVQSINCVRPK